MVFRLNQFCCFVLRSVNTEKPISPFVELGVISKACLNNFTRSVKKVLAVCSSTESLKKFGGTVMLLPPIFDVLALP